MAGLNTTQWLTETDPAPIYLMVNTQAKPNPVEILYANDWIEDAFRIYDSTPLAHITEQSPWLILLKQSSYPALGRLMDSGVFSDPSWGWAYRSSQSLQENLDHWRRRQLVTLKGNTVILRLADSRVAGILFPAMNKEDWRILMTPVARVLVTTPELKAFHSLATHCDLPAPEIQHLPFELKPHLIRAWQQSTQALIFYADNIACELWENQPEEALILDTPEGELMHRLDIWFRQQLSLMTDINFLTYEDFLRHAKHKGWMPSTDGGMM
ncbi:MAG TPA: DUF4123 domain-containing protein [Morganella sp. (in: Bacteria)]|nr:DUF4123 domain-containing protein [Morganella sp. (in: enterobacteria)]